MLSPRCFRRPASSTSIPTILIVTPYHPKRGGNINFDEPAAIDVRLLLRHLTRLRQGAEITKPIYDFATHTRVGARRVDSAPLIIIEGLHVLWWPALRRHFDVKVYVDCPAYIRLLRRIDRDTRVSADAPRNPFSTSTS